MTRAIFKFRGSASSSGFVGLAFLATAAGCSGGYGNLRSTSRITVALTSGDVGTPAGRLPLDLAKGTPFAVHIEAHRPDGSVDESFNGWTRVSSKPGAVTPLDGPGTSGRNVHLANGRADVSLRVIGAYGDSRIWAEDLGYVPVDPTRNPPPACADGKDNNGDGTIDYPNDPGCAYPNDDTEEIGSYVAGTTDVIHFVYPRVADVRGISQGGGATAFPHDQVQIDTGYRPTENKFAFSLVVTRIASDGFYVTDLDDPRGYTSIFAYNFSAPPRLRVCDRLTGLNATASDFFGFTELGFPTWQTEEWDPLVRPCLVPEPYVLGPAALSDTSIKLNRESSLVRVITNEQFAVHVGSHFGKDFPSPPGFTPTETASNCDINKDGKIDFYHDPEMTCSSVCDSDPECTEYSNYASRSEFFLVVHDGSPGAFPADAKIQVNASTAALIDPLALRGKPIKSFTGTFRYFSGGSQFTIEARCQDDIVVDPGGQPLTSDKACVYPRTASDQNNASN